MKYLQFVESMTQYGVHLRWPYELREEGEEGKGVPVRTQTSRWPLGGRCTLRSALTLGGMSYTSGIQSPFHRTPQRPRGGIRLRSGRACTLQSEERAVGKRKVWGSRPGRQTERKWTEWREWRTQQQHLLTQLSVTTLFLSSHSSPLEI